MNLFCLQILHFGTVIANKLIDSDFLSEVGKADINVLTGTHVHDGTIQDLHIPGYVHLDYKNRPMLETILVQEVLRYLRKKIYRRYFNSFIPRTRA